MILTILPLVAGACGGGEGAATSVDAGAENPAPIVVVATTTILGDVVSQVVGQEAAVEVIMPIGADAHDFQASSAQVSMMSTADLLVAIGLGLEEGMHDALVSAETDGAHVLEVAPLLDPLPFGVHEHEVHAEEGAVDEECGEGDAEAADDHEDEPAEGEENGHESGSCDPHVWMDPLRMAEAARLIAAELEDIAPGGGWAAKAEGYAEELSAAHEKITDILSVIPEESRVLVTNHESLGYFAELYDFEVAGVVIPGGSTLADPSSGELAALVEVIVEEGVPAIFTDLSSSSALAEAVADEVGDVEVVGLYSESLGEPGSDAETLIGMLTTNAESIVDSLS
jgi:zinc/manganese transport system substrate-binding protein